MVVNCQDLTLDDCVQNVEQGTYVYHGTNNTVAGQLVSATSKESTLSGHDLRDCYIGPHLTALLTSSTVTSFCLTLELIKEFL